MSSFACENIHQGHEQINDEFRGRKQVNLCLAALLCDQYYFCRFVNGSVKISIKFFSTDVVFFLVHPAVLKYQMKINLLLF